MELVGFLIILFVVLALLFLPDHRRDLRDYYSDFDTQKRITNPEFEDYVRARDRERLSYSSTSIFKTIATTVLSFLVVLVLVYQFRGDLLVVSPAVDVSKPKSEEFYLQVKKQLVLTRALNRDSLNDHRMKIDSLLLELEGKYDSIYFVEKKGNIFKGLKK